MVRRRPLFRDLRESYGCDRGTKLVDRGVAGKVDRDRLREVVGEQPASDALLVVGADTDPTPRPENPGRLVERRPRVGEMVDHVDREDEVELRVGEGQP